MPTPSKKLIEVALPLEEINAACSREKSIRHGHPSTLHLWWARRPLAAARAVIFAQIVDDPSGYVDELRQNTDLLRAANRELKERLKVWRTKKETFEKAAGAGMKVSDPGSEPTLDSVLVERERERLFTLIRQLVQWENTTNEAVLDAARQEIRRSWQRNCKREGLDEQTPLPAFHDPFAGGGALPLEAQRLGLETYASDLNPVAVLINKAMIEIPPKFAGCHPVNPEWQKKSKEEKALAQWKGAQGLAEDVRYYGQWMRDEAEKRIGHLYPKVEITAEIAQERPDLQPLIGQKLTVIAWLWARTVKSPNPAFCQVDVPLASTFMLSTKAGKEAWVEPVIKNGGYCFIVRRGKPKDAEAVKAGTKLGRGANFRCVMSGTPIAPDYIKAEGKAGRMGARLMAVVAEGERGRVYLSSTHEHETTANNAKPEWNPEGAFVEDARAFTPFIYGLGEWQKLFTGRQLLVLTTFSDLIHEARKRIQEDAIKVGMGNEPSLASGGSGSLAYAEAVSVFLAFAIGRSADKWAALAIWNVVGEKIEHVFGMHVLRMTWDFAEGNPFSGSTGNWTSALAWGERFLSMHNAISSGRAFQADAQTQSISDLKVISTDPPYYDNVPYADLSDFFYIWLRPALRPVFGELFATVAVPKAEELVATPYRHGGKQNAEMFFLDGMTQAMGRLAVQAHTSFPVTIYYAFKQSENDSRSGIASTGWETFLDAVIRAGFAVTGTWPMRTERAGRLRDTGSNALASSIVLACRQRPENAPMATRKEFVSTVQREMPQALRDLQHGNLAPVDLPQSAIGPGMAIFTRYSKIVEADGKGMSVRAALQIINNAIDEFLSAQESQMDDWTRFAVTWFSQYAFAQGSYGDAQNIATARNISVEGVREAGLLESGAGRVRLLRPAELSPDWDPVTDKRLTVWEIVHQLIRLLKDEGESSAAHILSKVGGLAEDARSLCYRLYTICEQKRWSEEARDYNSLIVVWPELTRLAAEQSASQPPSQAEFGLNT